MVGVISGYDFGEMEVMKYYAPPAAWDDRKKKETVHNRIFSGDWYAAEKKDGFFGKFVKSDNGEMILYSRSRGVDGSYANKIEWVPQLHDVFSALPNGTCLLGELYLPSQPGSKCVQTILGCLKDKAIARQDKGEKIHFYVFDCLAWNGENMIKRPYLQRIGQVTEIARNGRYNGDYIEYAKYYHGGNLWGQLQTILADGGEGMVIMHKDGVYEPGKRPSKTTLKVKKELKQTIDCFFTGNSIPATVEYTGKEIETWEYWEHSITGEKYNENKYNDFMKGKPVFPITKGHYYDWAGSLEIGVLKPAPGNVIHAPIGDIKGMTIESIGWLSGLADEIKANPFKYSFKPIEVSAMELDDDGKQITLRHGRAIGWRSDLSVEDCTLAKIRG